MSHHLTPCRNTQSIFQSSKAVHQRQLDNNNTTHQVVGAALALVHELVAEVPEVLLQGGDLLSRGHVFALKRVPQLLRVTQPLLQCVQGGQVGLTQLRGCVVRDRAEGGGGGAAAAGEEEEEREEEEEEEEEEEHEEE